MSNWFDLVNRNELIISIYDISFENILTFTQVHTTFHSTAAFQEGFFKCLGDVGTVLLDWVCLSLFCFFMWFQTDWMIVRSDLCVEHWLLSDSLCKQKSHWIITINGKSNVWKCKLIFPTDTLQRKITGILMKILMARCLYMTVYICPKLCFMW